MRILFIAGSFPPQKCGVGDYTRHLARALSYQAGVRVAVLADEEVAHADQDRHIEVFPVARGWRISDIPRIVKILNEWKPEIVHIQYPTQGFYGRKPLPYDLPLIVKCLGFRVVQTWHEHVPWNSVSVYIGALVTSKIIVVKPDYAKYTPRHFRFFIPSKDFLYIPNASTIRCAILTDAERASIRDRFAGGHTSLVAYFGFVYPHKGVEHLFRIADPEHHHIVLISDLMPSDPYHRKILDLVHGQKWSGRVTVTGFLPEKEAGDLLYAVDAVIFPFLHGAAAWNTSILGAASQGTFILTTSKEKRGYKEQENIYYAETGNIDEMRDALDRYIGRKNTNPPRYEWEGIANAHMDLYRRIVT